MLTIPVTIFYYCWLSSHSLITSSFQGLDCHVFQWYYILSLYFHNSTIFIILTLSFLLWLAKPLKLLFWKRPFSFSTIYIWYKNCILNTRIKIVFTNSIYFKQNVLNSIISTQLIQFHNCSWNFWFSSCSDQ